MKFGNKKVIFGNFRLVFGGYVPTPPPPPQEGQNYSDFNLLFDTLNSNNTIQNPVITNIVKENV